ncbi:hypothetical protein I6A82_07375 [Novosphingopyxis sp. YJ-S2-01]|nr:hypothetical protein [Novosphingopyxis sp. YJ-S2-01]
MLVTSNRADAPARPHPKDTSPETEAAWEIKRALKLHEVLQPSIRDNAHWQEAVQSAHAIYAALVERDA